MKSRYQRIISAASSSGQNIGPPYTVSTGCPLNKNDVTTPKLPPPPRTAQNRSEFSFALATTNRPSASTISTASRLSIVESVPPRQITHPAAQRQPRHSCCRNDSRRYRQPERMRRMIHVAPQRASAHLHRFLLRVHANIIHLAKDQSPARRRTRPARPHCGRRHESPRAASAPAQNSPPPSRPPRPRTAQSTAAAAQSSRCTPCAPRRNPHPPARSAPPSNSS